MKVLVYRIGALGDTLMALPAFWAIREYFSNARLTLLCEYHPGHNYIAAPDVLNGTNIFHSYELYPICDSSSGKIMRIQRFASLWHRLASARYDALVYLAPSRRSNAQRLRDKLFFRLCGIKSLYGMVNASAGLTKAVDTSLPTLPSEADVLLARLKMSGIPAPPKQKGRMDLRIGEKDIGLVQSWLTKQRPSGTRKWIGIGVGSKMPAKQWPVERYALLVQTLIEKFDVWPVVLGGATTM